MTAFKLTVTGKAAPKSVMFTGTICGQCANNARFDRLTQPADDCARTDG